MITRRTLFALIPAAAVAAVVRPDEGAMLEAEFRREVVKSYAPINLRRAKNWRYFNHYLKRYEIHADLDFLSDGRTRDNLTGEIT